MVDSIKIKGAREHNLKNIDIEIPRNRLVCLVGVSGSGKTTITFDIIHAEGQRQYLNSLSSYAARLLQNADRPDIDNISGLSSTIAIKQRRLRGSTRSTVGTTTELYTYLRLLFSRIGSPQLSASHFSFNNPKGACKKCKGLGTEYNIDPHSVLDFEKSLNDGASKHNLFRPGSRYLNIIKLSKKLDIDKLIKNYSKEELDFLLYSPKIVLSNKEQGFVQTFSHEGIIIRLIGRAKDLRGQSERKKKTESQMWITKPCEECNGARLNKQSLAVKINNKNISDFVQLPLSKLVSEFKKIDNPVAVSIVKKMIEIVQSLLDVGIGYLDLNRSVNTLSGGEAQRVKLARELGSDLIEQIYILDEPTAGLHPKDVENLINILKRLRDSQNTVIIVEHDADVMKSSDFIIEMGPKGGIHGGKVIASGTPKQIMQNKKSVTGTYLRDNIKQIIKSSNRTPKGYLEIKNANTHNLKNVSVQIPIGVFTAVTGVSGSGKSSLITDTFAKKFADKIALVDQSSIGLTPRGNIATYTKAIEFIREVLSKENKVDKSLFSSNSKGGCPECNGLGYIKTDMHFMADVKTVCEVCEGKKYTKKVLEYRYNGKNINDILKMNACEAIKFFNNNILSNKLQLLLDVGLDYVELGQTLDTLSGGESQRLKLASKLQNKNEFYVLDEPTSGLHFADIEKLLKLLHGLVDAGNSVLVVEHNLDIIRSADWIIELGPEGGDKGGKIVVEGFPEQIAKNKKSETGRVLL